MRVLPSTNPKTNVTEVILKVLRENLKLETKHRILIPLS